MFEIHLYFNYVSYLLTLLLDLCTKNILNQIIEPGLTRSNRDPKIIRFSFRSGFKNTGSLRKNQTWFYWIEHFT